MMTKSGDNIEILIAEDSPTQAEQLHYILTQHGYQLTVVRNGREALAAIAQHPPTLVISDVIMPLMDGYELCSHIKHESTLRNLPVILLTSLSDPADVVKGLESGADSFIFKPYDEQYLLTRISYTLANRHLRENESAQMGVEVVFAGRKFFITSDRLQILNLLLSTYEAAVHKNHELTATQDELRNLNDNLETRIRERTLALESEVVERKQAQSKLQSQLGRLDLLYQITRAASERQDLPSIFQVMIRRLEDDLPVDFGCVGMYEPATDSFAVVSIGVKNRAVGKALALARETGISILGNELSRCMKGQLIYEPDTAQLQLPFAQRLARGGLRSLVIAPMLAESTVFGVIIAARAQANAFHSADCEFLRQLSEHVALAAHQTQLHANLQRAYDDLRQSQHSFMQQERLRALGQMASGVAHDINNAISPVALYAESLLEQEQAISERGRKYLVTIRRAIEDVAQTVTRMREFYRPQEPHLAAALIDINQLIEQVLDLTRVRWRDEAQQRGLVIDVKTELASDLPPLKGLDSEIRDALTNLIFNAIDAMPAGGTLTLRTRAVAEDDGNVHPHDADRAPDVVRLEVSDTGIGMDAETRRRCLEPFFTTKGERGTGMGLAMIYGMAQRHGAELEIESEPGAGTTIRLNFAAAVIEESPTLRVPVLRMPEHPARLLLVDDDPLIVESLSNTLSADGHTVVAVDGGQAGIDAFTTSLSQVDRFALVITDLGMPYVDGRRVAAAIKAASPSTPVIMLTGWGQRLVDDNEMPQNVDRVLNKPPKLADLRRALADLIHTA